MKDKPSNPVLRLALPLLIAGFIIVSLALFMQKSSRAQAAPPALPRRKENMIAVNTFADELDENGDCSLREAVQAANTQSTVDACPAGTGNDMITLSEGVYQLSLAGREEDGNASGDLDVSGALTVTGASSVLTFVQAGTNSTDGIDRVFQVLEGGKLQIESLTVQFGNTTAGSAADNHGGGIAVDSGGWLDVYRSSLSENTSGDGGGIYADNASVSLRESVINDNQATSSGGGYSGSGTLDINLTSLYNNQGGEGGAVKYSSGTGNISNSTFSENAASDGSSGSAGAIDNSGDLDIWNSTFAGNSALAEAGAIRNSGSLSLLNVTLAGNDAPSAGGLVDTGGTTQITNSIIAGNSGGDCSGTITSLDYNLDGDSSCNLTGEHDQAGVDPMLATLADYGGYTWTMALLAGSPAIDAGDCSGGGIMTDQRGAARPKGAGCDAGAYEFGPLAADDFFTAVEDTLLSQPAPGVMQNDYSETPMSVTVAVEPVHGVLSLNPDGSFTYMPDANYNGEDTFTYSANNGALVDTAQVTLKIGAVNDAPVAVADSYTTTQGVQLVIAAPGVIANDSDVEGDLLQAVLKAEPLHGTLALAPDGSFRYTPDVTFSGIDTFQYAASDASQESSPVTVAIVVVGWQNKIYLPISMRP